VAQGSEGSQSLPVAPMVQTHAEPPLKAWNSREKRGALSAGAMQANRRVALLSDR